MDGARVGTGERELHLGQVYGVNPQQLPSTVQYVALGHLHRPQEVLAPAKTRYPGSLIELDFGEQVAASDATTSVVPDRLWGLQIYRAPGACAGTAGGAGASAGVQSKPLRIWSL